MVVGTPAFVAGGPPLAEGALVDGFGVGLGAALGDGECRFELAPNQAVVSEIVARAEALGRSVVAGRHHQHLVRHPALVACEDVGVEAELQDRAALGFDGELGEFFEFVFADPQFFYDEPEQLIERYRDMSVHIESLAPKLFALFPETRFEVRRVEPYREQSAAKGSYQSGSPDGTRPGIFYANAYNVSTRPKWDMQSLFLHEAIPGHHFQISLQRENEALPRFRRFNGFTAYSEGWGLYSESLGKELGVYTDPMDYFGSLNAELWRSIRLVVDTGIHAKGWTRQQVLDYMHANSASSETRAIAEAERFMAIPGQALAYKIGMLKIREIRAQAEAQLGDKFDVRAFHSAVLNDGPMPLSMLEAKIQRWVEQQM